MSLAHEHSLSGDVRFEGVGVHTGAPVTMTLKPAAPGTGIRFYRTDLPNPQPIEARGDKATELRLGTTLANCSGQTVATVEHLLAAFAGVGLDNARVELDGPEVPVMDGSARIFCEEILRAGLSEQDRDRQIMRVLSVIEVEQGESWARLEPGDKDWLEIEAEIDFETSAIGKQRFHFDMAPGRFVEQIGFARTFGFAHEVEALKAQGLARGGSLDNAVVIENDMVLNPEGLRAPDEFIRHKILDVVGDLMLAGHPIAGLYTAHRPGHAINNKLVRTLFEDPASWRIETLGQFSG